MTEDKFLRTECPVCQRTLSIRHATSLLDILGCTVGCPSCGEHLFCLPVKDSPSPAGRLVLFDDKKHTALRSLPKE